MVVIEKILSISDLKKDISDVKDSKDWIEMWLNGKYDMLSGADAFNINEVLDKKVNLNSIILIFNNILKQKKEALISHLIQPLL